MDAGIRIGARIGRLGVDVATMLLATLPFVLLSWPAGIGLGDAWYFGASVAALPLELGLGMTSLAAGPVAVAITIVVVIGCSLSSGRRPLRRTPLFVALGMANGLLGALIVYGRLC